MTIEAPLLKRDRSNAKRPAHLWKKGQSGNPKGRPKGCKDKSTRQAQLLAQGMLNSQVVQLVQKLLKMALDGDAKAMKLCIERILPPLKEPAEPKQLQHQIEVILRQPGWLQIEQQPIIELNGKELSDEQG
jgi:Family of unknown function (DUF5681)